MPNLVFVPKSDAAAEFSFYQNAKTRKKYPNAELEFLGMEAQEGEIVSLKPVSQKTLKENLVIEVSEGRVELIDFGGNWEKGELSDDAIIWDIGRMIEAWASDE